ncbi:MAG: hypothetical protein ACE5HO_09260 [bacterium]
MILRSLKSGFVQMWANKRMVLVFYLANLLFGVILMLPFRAIVTRFVGHSLVGQDLAGRLDMDFLFEFLTYNKNVSSIFFNLVLIFPALYWLVSLFLSGGAFAVFLSGEKYSPGVFWGSTARFAGRFFRLALWSIPVLALLFCLQFVETGVQRLFFGSDPYQNITYWGGWIKVGLRTLSILLFGLVLDYARIHLVLTDERKTRRSLWRGLTFAFGKLTRTFGLAFILFVVGAVVLAIYNPVANSLAAPNALVILLLFLVQQLYLFFRMMLRLTLFASELHLYQGLSAAVQTAPVTPADDVGVEGVPA